MFYDVIVVGAGVIGMLSALRLAEQGQRVLILERGVAGREASWAGGGIVSPLYPWRYGPAVTALAHWSQDFYPGFGEALAGQTGIDPQVHRTGLFWLDMDDETQALEWALRYERPLEKVAIDEAYGAIGALGAGFGSALHMASVANVRNPRLVKALRKRLIDLGVTLFEQQGDIELMVDQRRVTGVRTQTNQLLADATLVAAGAWSGDLLRPLGLELPVVPVKGQMLLYKCREDFLPSMVLARGRYAIPRRDGHVLIGSTLEHAGYDKTPTEEALASLRASAEALLPALSGQAPIRQWAGLRPGSPDGVPFIGEVPGYDGLWLNCGHYRNGLVLAPASCQLLADLVLGRAPIIDPLPYDPRQRLEPL